MKYTQNSAVCSRHDNYLMDECIKTKVSCYTESLDTVRKFFLIYVLR
jgi:hypothetical protein